jgi:MGT family glycosyltransferase
MTGSIVVMCVRGVGHLHVLLPVIEELGARGLMVHVMTHADYRQKIEGCGARFFDLFARYPIEAADATSRPIPCRYVTFAAVYAESLIREVAALRPALIVYDTFSVAAPLVARRLGVPYVNVCPNHAPVPARVVAALREDPRVDISAACWAAVERLREVHGWSTASPFSYVEALSPYLNVYAEPEEFLDREDRTAFEPLAFFGSLAPSLHPPQAPGVFSRPRRGARIFVSFGTLIWRYFAVPAHAALSALCRTFADLDVDAVVSLGDYDLEPASRAELEHPNVRVVSYADQWAALREADVFVTHHGINSTHESIFHEVPMISYPFFGDQPALARRCQDLGLAVALAEAPCAPFKAEAVLWALARLSDDRDGFKGRLAEARSWELRTIAGRGAVIDRILALAKAR